MFKIHAAKITQFGPRAIVITTSFKNDDGNSKGESFVIFPKPHSDMKLRVIRFEDETFTNTPVELNEQFVFDELMNQASIEIDLHIQEHYADKSFLIPAGDLQMTEQGVTFLVQKQIRGEGDFLLEIANQTSYKELRDTLNPITLLSPFTLHTYSNLC